MFYVWNVHPELRSIVGKLIQLTSTAATYTWWRRWRWPALLQRAHALCWPAGVVCSWSAAGRSAGESRSWPAAGHWGRGRWRRSGRTSASPSLRCRWPRRKTPGSLRRRRSSRTAGWGTTMILLYSGVERESDKNSQWGGQINDLSDIDLDQNEDFFSKLL